MAQGRAGCLKLGDGVVSCAVHRGDGGLKSLRLCLLWPRAPRTRAQSMLTDHVVCSVWLRLQASLASLRAEWSAELAALKTDVEHKRRMAAAALKARQEEEDIKVLPGFVGRLPVINMAAAAAGSQAPNGSAFAHLLMTPISPPCVAHRRLSSRHSRGCGLCSRMSWLQQARQLCEMLPPRKQAPWLHSCSARLLTGRQRMKHAACSSSTSWRARRDWPRLLRRRLRCRPPRASCWHRSCRHKRSWPRCAPSLQGKINCTDRVKKLRNCCNLEPS